MGTQKDILRSNRNCGRFFLFLALFSFALACLYGCLGLWGIASLMLPGLIYFGWLGWWTITRHTPGSTAFEPPDDSSGPPDAGKLVPIRPSPTHHLVAARELPPSDRTHSWPRD